MVSIPGFQPGKDETDYERYGQYPGYEWDYGGNFLAPYVFCSISK
jgi:hypothetical protein